MIALEFAARGAIVMRIKARGCTPVFAKPRFSLTRLASGRYNSKVLDGPDAYPARRRKLEDAWEPCDERTPARGRQGRCGQGARCRDRGVRTVPVSAAGS